MTPLEFHEFVKTICSYYERKMPTDAALDLWQQRVGNIPSEPIDWIQAKIFDQFEAFPKNLPSVIWDLYNAWLNAYPDRRARKPNVSCPDCESGWLILERDHDPYTIPITATAPCASCRQISMAESSYMSLSDAERMGMRRKNLVSEHSIVRRSIHSLIDEVTGGKQT